MPPALPGPRYPARHWPLAQRLLDHLIVRPAVRAEFSTVWLHTAAPPPTLADGPLVACVSHVGWWDAYMLFLIEDWLLKHAFQNYIMMEEKQLQSFRFFTWCGAFSIDRKTLGGAEASIGYIARLLAARRERCLWIFPQGRIVSPDARPVQVFGGVARVVQQCGGATVWPIALRYEFRGQQQPEALIYACAPFRASAATPEAELTARIAAELTAGLDANAAAVRAGDLSGYQAVMRGRQGIDQLTDQMLGLLRGRRRRAPR